MLKALFDRLFGGTTQNYTVIARYRTGHWYARFTVNAQSAYWACRKFDQENLDWVRISGASLATSI